MNDNIRNDIKALTDVNNKHQSEMKTMNDNISATLQILTAANSNTANHEEQFTEISSKLSDYEDRINKLSIKDTGIHPLSLHITKLTDTIYKFHLRALAIKSELILIKYKTGHINNLTGKYIMELSKLKISSAT